MAKPSWIMAVPVISTAHTPAANALETLVAYKAVTADGGFVYVDYDLGDDHWLKPIAAWLSAQGFGHWVRFDAAADTIKSLPTYPWSEA